MKYKVHSVFGIDAIIEAETPKEAALIFNNESFPKEFNVKVNEVLIRNSASNIVYNVSFECDNQIKHAWICVDSN